MRKIVSSTVALLLAGCLGTAFYQLTSQPTQGVYLAQLESDLPYGYAQFFGGEGYLGEKAEMNIFNRADANLDQIGVPDDQMSSFKLGPGVRARLCFNYDCSDPDHWTIELIGPYQVGVLWDGTNDAISHISLFEDKGQDKVNLFTVPQFGLGRSGLFGPGTYTNWQLESNHLWDHGVSSLIVPGGMVVTLFKGDFNTGEQITIIGPKQVDLYNDKDYSGWDNNVHSMIVKKGGFHVVGQWELAAYGNGLLSRSIEVGTTVQDQTIHESIVKDSFVVSAEAGYEFAGAYAKTSMTTETSRTIRDFCMKYYEKTTKTTTTFTCENKDGQLVGLYQWSMKSSAGDQAIAGINTEFYLCRYGIDANSQPHCPLTQCRDANCNECINPNFLA